MPGRRPGPSIKRPRMYEGLRRRGMLKARAAAISNAAAGRKGRKGGRRWTR